jgi:hypothetical protein
MLLKGDCDSVSDCVSDKSGWVGCVMVTCCYTV